MITKKETHPKLKTRITPAPPSDDAVREDIRKIAELMFELGKSEIKKPLHGVLYRVEVELFTDEAERIYNDRLCELYLEQSKTLRSSHE